MRMAIGPNSRPLWGALLAAAALATLGGCGAPVAGGNPDAVAPPPDAGTSGAGADAGADPGADAGTDAGHLPALCSESAPEGDCPYGRSCRDGACIVDLDPGDPAQPDAARAEFDALWQFYAEKYGAFPAKSVDWDEVRQRYRARLELVSTRFEATWLYAQAVAELQDGHAGLYSHWLCERTRGYGSGWSNIGACLVEAGGRLVVGRVAHNHPLGLVTGDEIVEIDGRGPAALLRDLAAQPRCSVSASTPAMARRALVSSLMFRPLTDGAVRVRRAGGDEVDHALAPALANISWLRCGERVGVPSPTDHGHGVESRLLDGGILYIHLPMFGGYDPSGNFIVGPVISSLREAFQQAPTSQGVVLDLRDNPGGSPQVYLALASWLYAQPTRLFSCQSKVGPGPDDFGAPWNMWAQPDATLQYAGRLAVLINAATFSAGDFSSAFLKTTGRATTFGHPSGGGFGNGSGHAWSSDLHLGYNDILCRDVDGNLLEGSPPEVDVPVSWSVADLRDGRDPVVEAAVEWLKSGVP
jgi:C-terminal processing protease CtpA/Prc